ncbi:hypothetical protein Poly51_33490 [Rubripirellula tenax]|uniref:Lipoprotein n=1 Tax=Rubripirellula tenax TaxID=2528015 RepID=A0A5C6F292_9BACT|nr:hypothetical protein [Rubripirellula tenax]TWU54630.1 hypothetical protein Poly51_33490 [Rubripirellula tenax]
MKRICLLLVVFSLGCLPASKPPVVEGPIDTSTASQLQATIRAKHGSNYSIEHQLGDKTFSANWELGNALKKSAQLQIKPPGDWTEIELYQALEVVLSDHESNPWYSNIDHTVLRLMRESLQSGTGELASDFVAETPYDVNAKVKKNGNEWFLQIKTQILDEDGNALGF